MNEVWKPLNVKGFEGRYFISNTGLIKTKRGRIRKLTSVCRKRTVISLCKTVAKRTMATTYIVKNLVASHFIPNPDNLKVVVNIDGNIFNNATYNLRWAKRKAWNYGAVKEPVEQTVAFKIKVELRRHGGREQLLADIKKKECVDALSGMFAKYELNNSCEPGYIFNFLCPDKNSNYSHSEVEAAIYIHNE